MNKRSSLEDFIRDHRSEFDDLKAPEGVWKRINAQPVKVHSIWKWSAIAASALLLISIGYIAGSQYQHRPDIAGWKEYEETEQYYATRIQSKMDLIKTLPVSAEVTSDLQVLDDVYQQLKSQLMEDPNANPQVLLTAMIHHQQQKLEIMEKILTRVDKYKSNENEIRKM